MSIYADQRYYASAYGRFTTVDPLDSSADPNDPGSWNRYVYADNDPINVNDPSGLLSCGDVRLVNSKGEFTGRTFAQGLSADSDLSLLTVTIFVESSGRATEQAAEEMAAIGAVIMNRYNLVNGFTQMYRSDGTFQHAPAGWGKADKSLASIVANPTQFQVWQGPPGGSLTEAATSRLNSALDADVGSSQCSALEQAYFTGSDVLQYKGQNILLSDSGSHLAFTGFNSFSFTQKYDWEQSIGQFGSANKFYGVPIPIPAPPPRSGVPTAGERIGRMRR
jgi:RHS repeat-associated protein